MYNSKWAKSVAAALVLSFGVAALALQPRSVSADTFKVTRANLAQSAAFTVTQTLAAKGSPKFVRVFKIVVKGEKARIDFDDPSTGSMSYIANTKGLFLYLPESRTAMKQPSTVGVEEALKKAFAQASGKISGAVKVGSATVSGQPTDIYKDVKSGSIVYVGTKPGFRLPVRFEQTNAGGTTSFLVTDIRLNYSAPESFFALPPGTQIMDSPDGGDAPPAKQRGPASHLSKRSSVWNARIRLDKV